MTLYIARHFIQKRLNKRGSRRRVPFGDAPDRPVRLVADPPADPAPRGGGDGARAETDALDAAAENDVEAVGCHRGRIVAGWPGS